MKNHFYIPYVGNKRQEVERLYEVIDFTDITTIIEPFCGSCAMSYYISTKKEGLKYILNDNNPYLKDMYEIMLDDDKIKNFENDYSNLFIDMDKDKYKELVKQEGVLYWFLANKYFQFRSGTYPVTRKSCKTINLKSVHIYNFFKNNDITFLTTDGLELYKKYNNCKNNLILLDPPYMDSCNALYKSPTLNIYDYLKNNNINNCNSYVILILENISKIEELFSNNKILSTYNKTYNMGKQKKTEHVIISNR